MVVDKIVNTFIFIDVPQNNRSDYIQCRLEPGAFDLGSLSPILTPMLPIHTTNSSQSLSTEAADQSSFDADFPASSECVGLPQCRDSGGISFLILIKLTHSPFDILSILLKLAVDKIIHRSL